MNYEKLVETLNYHCHLYYDLGAAEISDAEFDVLYDKCEEIEKAQGWIHYDSPTIKVGGSRGNVKHEYQLYSQRKVYDIEEIGSEYNINTPKLDGSNLTVTYNNGKLSLALRRGDGKFGDDVSHLAPYIKGLPKSLHESMGTKVIVTGECVTDNEDIENFRNYNSGALNLKDPEEFKSRNIRFIAHDWLGKDMNYTVLMRTLTGAGFFTVMDEELCSKYPQDGRVYRINDWKKCRELGYTSKYPKFAIALKSREKLMGITTLQEVTWEVGRTGTVNPVGIVEPIILDDATITRVTLHNIEQIEKHNLGLGDSIEIERAGGVIPKILRVIQHAAHNNKITEDDASRAVGDQLRRDGPRLYVCNPEKHGTIKLLKHFIKTLNIKGLGPQSIQKMKLNHPVDLYKKQNWSILGANGIKVQEEIERSKTKPYNTVLAALGIKGVGTTASDKIVKVIPYFSRLREIEYTKVPTIGPETIKNIISWLEINEEWVLELPLQLEQNISTILNDKPTKKICISGKLDRTKNEMAEILSEYGFTVVDSVTKDCYALITTGMKTGKYDKAEKYGIKIIEYEPNKNNILNGVL